MFPNGCAIGAPFVFEGLFSWNGLNLLNLTNLLTKLHLVLETLQLSGAPQRV